MKKLQQQINENSNGRATSRPYSGKIFAFFCMGVLAGIMLLVGVARLTWHSKFYPGITIAHVEVAGLTRDQARVKLVQAIDNYQLKLVFNGAQWTMNKDMVNFEIEPTLNAAYHYGRQLKISDYLLFLINKKTDFPLSLSEGKTDKFELQINELAAVIEIPPIDPIINIVGKKINVTNGVDGLVLDTEKLNENIIKNFSELSSEPVNVPIITAKKHLDLEKIAKLESRAATLLDKSLTLKLDDEKVKLNGKELVALLSTADESEILNKTTVDEYVKGISESLNKPPQEAKFEFVENIVKEFAPGKDGVEVNVALTADGLQQGIKKLLETEDKNENIEILATRTPPNVTTDKVNELGIKERIGRGESYYQHSIPNRIYNVSLASTRLNSALIGPGEEVSFNKLVGEVSGATGYRQAYIISGGRTILGDGGGLCQVSTTMFRAAMSAGLPILERWGHAYRVSYYELNSKPGVDATVIAPGKDFRFKNDTTGHILIQTINDPKTLHLIIEIYGSSDGRIATISEPKVWGNTPPLPTIYQDDPTLPTGVTKQVDWAAAGAKASFEYKVVRNGETIHEKTFSTTYQPWASVFLRGTAQ